MSREKCPQSQRNSRFAHNREGTHGFWSSFCSGVGPAEAPPPMIKGSACKQLGQHGRPAVDDGVHDLGPDRAVGQVRERPRHVGRDRSDDRVQAGSVSRPRGWMESCDRGDRGVPRQAAGHDDRSTTKATQWFFHIWSRIDATGQHLGNSPCPANGSSTGDVSGLVW